VHAKAKKPSAPGVAMCETGLSFELWLLLIPREDGMQGGEKRPCL
jgi:hypothetical protein